MLFAGRWFLCAVCGLLVVVCWLVLVIVCCSLCVVCRLLFVVSWLLCVVCCSSVFVVCCVFVVCWLCC